MFQFIRKLFVQESGGDRGERLAAEWLVRERKFTVLTRNWRNPQDRREEIDLVCRDGDALVFVEVKARSADALVPGYHAIDRRKKRVLRHASEAYLRGLKDKPRTFRFDVVEVTWAPARKEQGTDLNPAPTILHFENVPLFSKYFRG